MLGAAVVTDPLETIRAAQAQERASQLTTPAAKANLPTNKAELLELLHEVPNARKSEFQKLCAKQPSPRWKDGQKG